MGVVADVITLGTCGGLLLERLEVADMLLLPLDPRREPKNKRPADAI